MQDDHHVAVKCSTTTTLFAPMAFGATSEIAANTITVRRAAYFISFPPVFSSPCPVSAGYGRSAKRETTLMQEILQF